MQTQLNAVGGDGSGTVNGTAFVIDQAENAQLDGPVIDAAAVVGGMPGQGLSWFLNGERMDQTAFPGTGAAGWQNLYPTLKAGRTWALRIESDASGASRLDDLDISPAPGNPNAEIGIQSVGPVFLSDRLHFSSLEDPAPTGLADRDLKEGGTVRISNSGAEPLVIEGPELTGISIPARRSSTGRSASVRMILPKPSGSFSWQPSQRNCPRATFAAGGAAMVADGPDGLSADRVAMADQDDTRCPRICPIGSSATT